MKKQFYYVINCDLANGLRQPYVVKANTPKGASMIVNRDHYNRFSVNRVHQMVDNGKRVGELIYTSNML